MAVTQLCVYMWSYVKIQELVYVMCYVYDNIAYTDVDHEVFMTGNMLHGFLHV